MFDIFNKIWCAVTNVAWWLADLLVLLCNTLIGTLGVLLAAMLGILPDMPGQPGGLANDVLMWVNWMFPVAQLVAMFTVYFALYIAARIIMAAIKLGQRAGIVHVK